MLKQKMKLAMLSIGFLNLLSCQSMPTKVISQCSNVNSFCLCRDYELSIKNIGPISGFEEAPSEACIGMVYSLDDYLEMTEWLELAREKYQRSKHKHPGKR